MGTPREYGSEAVGVARKWRKCHGCDARIKGDKRLNEHVQKCWGFQAMGEKQRQWSLLHAPTMEEVQ